MRTDILPRLPRAARRALAAGWILLAVGLVAGCGGGATTTRAVSPGLVSADGRWHGTVAEGTGERPSFTLTDTSGHAFDFAEATRGRATLLFFGYTNCPDICPTTMADIAAAKRIVSPQVRAKLSVVFVTTDPARDTAGVIRRWLDQFDHTFVGLTGTAGDLEAAQEAVGIPVARPDERKRPGNAYDVAHAAQVTAFGADGDQKVLYFADAGVGDFAADLPQLATAAR